MTVDQVIAKYAEELETIYKNRTAGDYTFEGVLGTFLREVTAAKPSLPGEFDSMFKKIFGGP